jgi:hypothetical protein
MDMKPEVVVLRAPEPARARELAAQGHVLLQDRIGADRG